MLNEETAGLTHHDVINNGAHEDNSLFFVHPSANTSMSSDLFVTCRALTGG
jgi:hypothetical protein